MNKLFQDKVFIISGASGGIGKACTLALIDQGARVILLGRSFQKLSDLFNHLDKNRFELISLDITNDEDIQNCIKKVKNNYDRIDGFLHCAGYEITKPLRKTTRIDYLDLYNVNTVSSFCFIREILKINKKTDYKMSFVIISSIMSIFGERGKTAYCASKSALVSAVKALALEIAPKGHRVNCVSPGIVKTKLVEQMILDYPEDMVKDIYDMHPLGIGEPSDVANLVLFLLSDQAKWITGSNFPIDGGYSAK